MRVVSVVGARPQFIKAGPVSRALGEAGVGEYLVHTGQHYDSAMSQVFFSELRLRAPDVNLGVGSGSHAAQTAEVLVRVEQVLMEQRPQAVLVYGDTNSTLGAALAACKLRLPLAHVEAGLRSYNKSMPEEHNRVLTDHCADWLFCPTETARLNLAREGLTRGVFVVGDTMNDSLVEFAARASDASDVLERLGLNPGKYVLATVHRPATTDDPETLRDLLSTLASIDEPLVFPVHPRTRKQIRALGKTFVGPPPHHRYVEPVGYLDMIQLTSHARLVLTDSGGLQKEAYFFRVPCVTLRPETEWVETVEVGMNVVTGTDRARILAAVGSRAWPSDPPPLYGQGNAAPAIVRHLISVLNRPSPAGSHRFEEDR